MSTPTEAAVLCRKKTLILQLGDGAHWWDSPAPYRRGHEKHDLARWGRRAVNSAKWGGNPTLKWRVIEREIVDRMIKDSTAHPALPTTP